MSIDITTYPVLNTYAVLAGSGITAANITTITNGVYGTSGGAITGTYVGLLDNGNASSAQTQLTALGTAITQLSVTSSITGGTGTITYTPGRYNSDLSTIIYGSGTNIILDAQGNSNAQFFFTAGTAITFGSVNSITLLNGASICNIFWLAGSAISFSGTSPSSIPGIFIAGSAITFASESQILGRLYAKTAISFSGISSVNGNCTQDIVCYLKGTLILTKQGFIPIENIKAGHMVVTRGKIYDNNFIKNDATLAIEPVMWVSKFKVINLNSKSIPICIKKHALAQNYPFEDLYVSPGHRLLLNNTMILAKNIVNGKTIYQDNECNSVEYYHLECEYHSAIFANGVLAESYLNVNTRHLFENSISLRSKNCFIMS